MNSEGGDEQFQYFIEHSIQLGDEFLSLNLFQKCVFHLLGVFFVCFTSSVCFFSARAFLSSSLSRIIINVVIFGHNDDDDYGKNLINHFC